MKKWVSVFGMAFVLFGCFGGADESTTEISTGTYESQKWKTDPDYSRKQLTFKPDGSSAMASYFGGCLECEGESEWKVENSEIYIIEPRTRCRPSCDEPMGLYSSGSTIVNKIRNVTATSFEIFTPADEVNPASWDLWKKL